MTPIKKSIIAVTTIAITATSLAYLYDAGYRYNSTLSYPIGIYKLNKEDKNITRGKLVLVCPPDTKEFRAANKRGYVADGYCHSGFEPLIKKIAAVDGDEVIVDDFVTINGIKQPKSKVYITDPQGWKLMKTPKKRYLLKKKEIFLLSDYNKQSFDSRYFGVVDSSLVVGSMRAVLLWGFKEE